MQTIQGFLSRYSITTHSIVVAIGMVITAFYTVPEVHSLLLMIYAAVPGWAQAVIMAIVGLYLRYSTGLSNKGKLAVAADSAKAWPLSTKEIVDAAAAAPNVSTDLHVSSVTQKVVTLLLCLSLPFSTLAMTGCSQNQIAAEGKAISNALLSVANLEGQVNPELGAQLTQVANSIAAITSNWQTGSSEALFNDAANAAEVILSQIPQTAAIAPLIPIAVAAIDLLIETIHPSANSNQATTDTQTFSVRRVAANPYRGAKIKHRMMRSKAGDIKAAWNEVVAAHPELKSAEIK